MLQAPDTSRHMSRPPAQGAHEEVRPQSRGASDTEPDLLLECRMLTTYPVTRDQGGGWHMCILQGGYLCSVQV
jgi:hypothetical protein